MNSNANSVQHGGTHYQSDLQHWDMAAINGMDYFTAAATKYVTRWRKKDGRIALDKAAHFVLKAAELRRARLLRGHGRERIPIAHYAEANGLNALEEEICRVLCTWRRRKHLIQAHRMIEQLMWGALARCPVCGDEFYVAPGATMADHHLCGAASPAYVDQDR